MKITNSLRHRILRYAAGLSILALAWAPPALWGVTHRVMNPGPSGTGTLRQLVSVANPNDTIEFDVTGVIKLGGSPIIIGKNLNIQGPGTRVLTISGEGLSSLFEVTAGSDVRIASLTLREGVTRGDNGLPGLGRGSAGGSGGPATGGAIRNAGTLRLINCEFIGHAALAGAGGNGGDAAGGGAGGWALGGAIFNSGILKVNRCTFRDNRAFGGNGGPGGHNLSSPFQSGGAGGNAGGAEGGAIYSEGVLQITNCTLTANYVHAGISGPGGNGGNRGGRSGDAQSAAGGAIYADNEELAMLSCTISGNGAYSPPPAQGGTGGVAAGARGASASPSGSGAAWDVLLRMYLRNTILAGNQDGILYTAPDYAGSLVSAGFNLFGYLPPGASGMLGTDQWQTYPGVPLDPILSPVADNGGPTWTMMPRFPSPAIDRGHASALLIDQRGLPRTLNVSARPEGPGSDATDIGACEYVPSVRIQTIHFIGNTPLVSVRSLSGFGYRLEATDDLMHPTWVQASDTYYGTDDDLTLVDYHPHPLRRFYRVVMSE